MNCVYQKNCGGCPFRNMSMDEYRLQKNASFVRILQQIRQEQINFGAPVFIDDGSRRRAELAFSYKKGSLTLGFNAGKSHELTDISRCLSLTPVLNNLLTPLRNFLNEFCKIKTTEKRKNKKFDAFCITSGDIHLTAADNGVDILFKLDKNLSLEHRILLSEFAANNSIIRISVNQKNNFPETVIEKSRPYVIMGGYPVYISAGTFLQASAAGENALANLVLKYIFPDSGKIADLFCGVGTFSYPLAANPNNKITAADSSAESLDGFQKSVNANMLSNVKILKRNLFKYPLDAAELKDFDIVVFDPPRAGAAAQMRQLAFARIKDKPRKVIAVSCNPHTFVNDANVLLNGGYGLIEVTMVDQFVYTSHCELVALFEKKGENDE